MQLVISPQIGFCGGVRRAIKLAIEANENFPGTVRFDGEIVHNKQVIENLKSIGITSLDEHSHTPGLTVIIRAHGCPTERKIWLANHFSSVIDATCPHLIQITNLIKRALSDGKFIIIVGNENHPEVITLKSYSNFDNIRVINSEEKIKQLPSGEKFLVLAQSTISEDTFHKITNLILKKFPDTEIVSTICQASINRQRSVKNMVDSGVEAIVVIGGKHSNNTKTLTDAAIKLGVKAIHIETATELPIKELKKFRKVGVISGTSTDDSTIQEIILRLREL